MKRIFPILPILLMLSCGIPTPKKNTSLDSILKTLDSVGSQSQHTLDSMNKADVEKSSADKSWYYTEDEDKMTSEKKYYAKVDAKELVQFGSPYDGGSTATITIRNKDKANNVLLTVSSGQFNTGVDGTTIRIRFDEEQPIQFGCSEASDGSSNVLFIDNQTKFISKVKKAKKIIVEAEFYDNGKKQMEFNVEGLKWDH